MDTTGRVSRDVLAVIWLLLGIAMVAVPVRLGHTRWRSLLDGHPLLPGLALLCALLGVLAVAGAVTTLLLADRVDAQHNPPWSHRQLVHRATWRVVGGVPALLLCAALVGTVVWARPIPADAPAVEATRSSDTVRVVDRLTWLELTPARRDANDDTVVPTTGLVFTPAARVAANAYANVLRPLAEAGYLVAVLKEPLGSSLLQPDHAKAVLDVHPEIDHWAVGGHGAGGAAAAAFADRSPRVEALVLYAAVPQERLQRTKLRVLSVTGSADAVTPPPRVEAAKPDLPPTTRYLVVDGAAHSAFGDYGDLPGEGTTAIPRTTAQAQIQSATAAFLAALTPKKK